MGNTISLDENLELFLATGPFDKAHKQIVFGQGKLARAIDIARAQMCVGVKNAVSQNGTCVAENFVYDPERPEIVYVTPDYYSPLLKHPIDATRAHRREQEFFVPVEDYELILAGVKDKKVKVIKNEDKIVPLQSFTANSLLKFLYGEDAQKYATLLDNAKTEDAHIWLLTDVARIESQPAPFARPMWVNPINYFSVDGSLKGLENSNGAWGIRRITQNSNSVSPYETIAKQFGYNSPTDLQSALETLKNIKQHLN